MTCLVIELFILCYNNESWRKCTLCYLQNNIIEKKTQLKWFAEHSMKPNREAVRELTIITVIIKNKEERKQEKEEELSC